MSRNLKMALKPMFGTVIMIVIGLLVLSLKSFGENEPNNTIGTANSFEPTGSVGGAFSTADNSYDYFKIITPKDGKLTISVTADEGLCVSLYLYNETGLFTIFSNGTCGLDNYLKTFTIDNLAAGTYYLEAGNKGYGSYSLSNTFTATGLNPDYEPNNDLSQASTIGVNTSVEGHLGFRNVHFDYYDYYSVTTPNDGTLKLYVEPDPTLCVDLTIFNETGGVTLYYNGYCSNSSHSDTLVVNNLAAGTYKILASAVGFGSYRLTNFFISTALPNDIEENNLIEKATGLALNSEATGHLGYRSIQIDYDDYYKLVLPTNGKLSVVALPDTSLCLEMTLISGDGVYNLFSTGSCGNSYHKDTLLVDNLLAGVYFLRASSTGYGSYKLITKLGFATNISNKFSSDNEFNVYPNPFQNELHIAAAYGANSLCRIIDLAGKVVFVGKFLFSEGKGVINCSEITRGCYILEMANEKAIYRKLIQKY